MIRYQARQNLWVNGAPMAVWTVEALPATAEVAGLAASGSLVAEAEDGSFPDPVAEPYRCCGH